MALTYLGELSLGVALPGVATGFQAGIDGILLALPDIQARLDALAAFNPQPISLTANLALAQSIVASLQASISIGIQPPSIDAQIAIVAGLVASLQVTIGLINARLGVVIDLQKLLDAAGVFLYSYNGPVNGLGSDLTSQLASGVPGGTGASQSSNALVLLTTTPTTWSAISQLMKTS